jgi:hypothetical protein
VTSLVLAALLAAAQFLLEPLNGLLFAWNYAPKLWVAVVLLLIALPGWIWGRKLAMVLLMTALVWAGPGLGWRWRGFFQSAGHAAPERTLRVLTCNRGESGGHDFFPFVNEQDPDILVVQQSRSFGAWKPDATEIARRPHGAEMGEFLIRSRFPIVSQQLLVAGTVSTRSGPKQVIPGLRCVVEAGALGQIVIYDVHLPSPRQVLRDMGIGAPQASSSSAWIGTPGEMRSYWEMHHECARLIHEKIRAETLPTIAMGDWNNPDHGPLYREFADGLWDAHREAGRGYGYTFPDDVSRMLAGGKPWLRIDYILASTTWQVAGCQVEADAEGAQHRAVAAVLVLSR